MRLDEYLTAKKMSQGVFGALLNPPVSQTLVSQWNRGVTRVMLEQAIQIEVLTEGLVTPRELAEMFKPRESAEAA
ncbi:helix-turn-helix domain-containing protein [Paraburkholderia sp. CNPSo 3274]|uniref:helix-turn-helix domain-containing protein n=1 Tax=Paraburkholderia sp. CNPSo 3274 TaxID=2940932 RepID=UPI0020B66720|nr:helix-turn-helix domain-containing protein [Paraburkholderia sp. CNPSo 3274]MCP3709754.1 helix-turn-helix domain-containing protein [Paraburkholderia sp. CNPSo 3274]